MSSFPSFTGYDFAATLHTDTYPAIAAATCKQQGRAIFVTGASRGIGRACAIAFAKAGASAIALGARAPSEEAVTAVSEAAKAAGHPAPQVLNLCVDVANAGSVAAAAAAIKQVFGRLDILINNAGKLDPWINIADTDPLEWWKTWEVNVNGTYLVTRALLPLLLHGGEKTIINMSSIGAHLVRPGASSYQTAKLAVLRLTEYTAVEYGGQGVLAFALHPGAVRTDMTRDMPPDAQARMTDTPELSADTVVFLTQEKRMWLNGRYISASWDMPEILSREAEIVAGNKLKVRLAL